MIFPHEWEEWPLILTVSVSGSTVDMLFRDTTQETFFRIMYERYPGSRVRVVSMLALSEDTWEFLVANGRDNFVAIIVEGEDV